MTGDASALAWDPASRRWLLFERPREILEARKLADVLPALERLEAETRRSRWAAGFIAYEAAPAFDSALAVLPPDPALPLLWFGLFDEPREAPRAAWPAPPAAPPPDWRPDVSQAAYNAAIGRIKERIRRGDTYQVNYTLRLRAPLAADPRSLFTALIDAQEPACGVLLDTPDWALCSASPELFLDQQGDRLLTKPMKGTRPRGLWPAEDRRLEAELKVSEKERAEHVMIVDMARNDLGRISRTGSVRVRRAFAAEPFPTVWQMTSEVTGDTAAGLPDILRALFPAASITGAPKAATMRIIAELENSPRGAYTGAMGFVAPGRRCRFNVAIRTVRLDKRTGRAEYGTGGGIVWDSTAAAELEECRVKARVLTRRLPPFELLETLLWERESGYALLEEHLDRMRASARQFGFPLARAALRRKLLTAARGFPGGPCRVRLTASRAGSAAVEAVPLKPLPSPYRLRPAPAPVDPAGPLLYHKTTRREVYEAAFAARGEADDVLLWNPKGELTEATFANVLVEIDGAWCTPPVSCGLLGGLARNRLVARDEVRERVIRLDELHPGTPIRLVNSVRGVWEARWEPQIPA